MECLECGQEIIRKKKGINGRRLRYCSGRCGNKAGQKASYKRHREWLEKRKDVPCMDCGNKFLTCCMEFDHRPGEVKEFELSSGGHYPLVRVEKEASKCDLVCANCHRIRTRNRGL